MIGAYAPREVAQQQVSSQPTHKARVVRPRIITQTLLGLRLAAQSSRAAVVALLALVAHRGAHFRKQRLAPLLPNPVACAAAVAFCLPGLLPSFASVA